MARTAKNKGCAKDSDNSLFQEEQEISFEEALLNLEVIVKEMEAGELTLEEMLSKFAAGISLSKLCLNKINSAQETIDKILQEEPESCKLVLKPLNF